MANNRLAVDPDAMRDTAGSFDAVAEQADKIVANLVSAIAAVGECWGSDATGNAFGRGYIPARDQLLASAEGIGALMHMVADGVRQSADAYQAADIPGPG